MRKRIAWIVTGVAALLLIGPTVWAYTTTSGHRFLAGDTDIPDRPVVIVLGAGVRPDGLPTRLLSNRLDLAAELYTAGQARAVLVSGDNSVETYNETDVMRDYLIDAGVDPAHVVGDYAGFRTWDSCVRAREVFGVNEALVVTQAFHLPRAVALCHAAGLDASGVGDASFASRGPATVFGYVREIPATTRALVDALARPRPQFLGPYEDGVDAALRTSEERESDAEPPGEDEVEADVADAAE